jgi:predicted DNA-binding transcriptional regulator AlpA
MDGLKPLMTEDELCDLLSVAKTTLTRWRNTGLGPKFVRIAGQRLVRYRSLDIAEFLADRLVVPAELHSANGHSSRGELRCLSKHHLQQKKLHDAAVKRAHARMRNQSSADVDDWLRDLADDGDPIALAYREAGMI